MTFGGHCQVWVSKYDFPFKAFYSPGYKTFVFSKTSDSTNSWWWRVVVFDTGHQLLSRKSTKIPSYFSIVTVSLSHKKLPAATSFLEDIACTMKSFALLFFTIFITLAPDQFQQALRHSLEYSLPAVLDALAALDASPNTSSIVKINIRSFPSKQKKQRRRRFRRSFGYKTKCYPLKRQCCVFIQAMLGLSFYLLGTSKMISTQNRLDARKQWTPLIIACHKRSDLL